MSDESGRSTRTGSSTRTDSGTGVGEPDQPLKRAVFHILLALSNRELHGLGIAEEVERVTEGQIQLGPGTLYRSLKQMAERGLVQDVESPLPDDDPRRRYYGITEAGRAALEAEATRYERIVETIRERNVLPESRS